MGEIEKQPSNISNIRDYFTNEEKEFNKGDIASIIGALGTAGTFIVEMFQEYGTIHTWNPFDVVPKTLDDSFSALNKIMTGMGDTITPHELMIGRTEIIFAALFVAGSIYSVNKDSEVDSEITEAGHVDDLDEEDSEFEE